MRIGPIVDSELPPASLALTSWATLASLGIGALVLGAHAYALEPLFFLLALPTVVADAVLIARRTADPFNPLSIVIALALFRFTAPALLVWLDPSNARTTEIFHTMRLTPHDVSLGHVLALMGMLATALPWLFGDLHRSQPTLRAPREPSARWHAAVAITLIGFIAFFLFVRINSGGGDVALTGAFRSTEIQEGTGIWWYGGLFLISGSVYMSVWLAGRRRSWQVCLTPAFAASVAFFVMGGRARALTPIVCAVLVLWWLGEFRRPNRERRRGTTRRLLVAGALMLWVFSAGAAYRGGKGIDALWDTEAFGVERLQENMLTDLGQVHGVSGLVKAGPGIAGGRVLGAALAWPLTEFAPIVQAPSTGVEVLRRTAGGDIFGNRKWGLLPSIPGEAYFDFGLLGVLVLPAVLGWVLKRAYLWTRSGRFSLAANALVVAYLIRIYFESASKLSELWVVLFGVWAVGVGAQLLSSAAGKRSMEPQAITAAAPTT